MPSKRRVPETSVSIGIQVELWPIERLIPRANNPRTHSREQVAHIAASIKEFGWTNPVLVEGDDGILAGHARVLAARKLGMKEVPVIVLRHLSPAQRRALVIADNQLAIAGAGWDEEMLRMELAILHEENYDLDLVGFDDVELQRLLEAQDAAPGLVDEDSVPDVQQAPVARPGDVFVLGGHRIICGDCTDAGVVARLLGDANPLLLITDPPYGIELDSEWRDRAGLNGWGPAEASYMKHRSEGHTETTISGDTRADWSGAFEFVPSLQVAYVWHASVFTRQVWTGLERIGFLYPQTIIWNKARTVLTRTHYWYQHEPCLYMRKKNAPWYGKAGENSTVWDSPSPKFIMGGSDEEKFDHPTQKPMEVMRRPILNHTLPGESCYDPFLGSGTTLIAAEQTGRVCFGVELDPKYLDVIIRRWQMYTGKRAVLEGDGRTFDNRRGADWSGRVRQKLCRRLEELERISAAAAARRARTSSDYRRVFDELVAKAKARHADPEYQAWLAAQPPDYLYRRVQWLRAQLRERASGHSRQVQTGGFR